MVLTELLDELRPEWHAVALCRGDGPGRWTVERGAGRRVDELRSICRRCPAAGDCLRAGIDEPSHERDNGPMRCSLSGPTQWRSVRNLVAELEPTSRSDWESIAAWVLDGDVTIGVRTRCGGRRISVAERRMSVVELAAAGWTQVRIAGELDMSQTYVSRLLITARRDDRALAG